MRVGFWQVMPLKSLNSWLAQKTIFAPETNSSDVFASALSPRLFAALLLTSCPFFKVAIRAWNCAWRMGKRYGNWSGCSIVAWTLFLPNLGAVFRSTCLQEYLHAVRRVRRYASPFRGIIGLAIIQHSS